MPKTRFTMPIRKIVILALTMLVLVPIYLIRFDTLRHKYQAGDRVRVSGQISEDPTVIDNRQKLVVGGLKIYADRFPEHSYGEQIIAEGIVEEGKAGYFLKDAKIVKAGEAEGVVGVREKILGTFKNYLPEPHASLLSGIVLGTKSSLENSFFESLRNTGTLHVVVASGTNIALFSGAIVNLTAFLWGRQRSIFISFVLIWGYVTLIGFQAPIVRAAIMGCIAFIGLYLGKETAAVRALILSAALMLFVNPLWLFDLGFQLSFLATFGMVLLGQNARGIIGKIWGIRRLPRIFQESLSTTLAAQIAVTPLLFYTFGQISFISPLVNMLVLPVVPAIMAGGFVLGLLGLWLSLVGTLGGFGVALAQILAWFVWLPLEWFVQIVRLFGNY